MTPTNPALADVLEPVRDLHVAGLLELMARELTLGADVEAEPIERDAEGRVRRRPPLGLPRRLDLRATREGRALALRAPRATTLRFAPIALALSDVSNLHVAPFCWGAVTLFARGAAGAPNWAPVRLWLLEWLQARFGEESPDLLGAVHAIDGPVAEGDGWRFAIDLGSAPAAGFIAMAEAFGRTGCAEIRVGETEDAL